MSGLLDGADYPGKYQQSRCCRLKGTSEPRAPATVPQDFRIVGAEIVPDASVESETNMGGSTQQTLCFDVGPGTQPPHPQQSIGMSSLTFRFLLTVGATASAVGSDYGSREFRVSSTVMSPFIFSIEPWGLVGTSSLKLNRIKLKERPLKCKKTLQ